MRRGEIWMIDFEPATGSAPNKLRPAVVVTNDAANSTATRLRRGVVTVVPVTSNMARALPFQVVLPALKTGLERDLKAQAELVRSVSIERVSRRVGAVPANLMAEIDDALRIHLGL